MTCNIRANCGADRGITGRWQAGILTKASAIGARLSEGPHTFEGQHLMHMMFARTNRTTDLAEDANYIKQEGPEFM
jgi:hypothetical protein